MAEKTDTEQLTHQLFEQVTRHVETRWDYFTLSATEKLSGVVANLVGVLIIFLFGVLVLFFFSMGLAWWLGDVIGSRAGGFAIAGLIFIPVALASFMWIRPFVRNIIIQAVLDNENQENDTTDEKSK